MDKKRRSHWGSNPGREDQNLSCYHYIMGPAEWVFLRNTNIIIITEIEGKGTWHPGNKTRFY